MTPIPQWLSIKERILAEYKKHPSLDWAEIAARKIVASLTTLTDEELQREAEEEYPVQMVKIFFEGDYEGTTSDINENARRAYINGRKKSIKIKQ
jgi:hypothetical protein